MEKRKNDEFYEKAGHRTIFHELINSPHLPTEEKGTIRIIQEAGAMVGAGGESTSQVITAFVYCLLANPQVLSRLREELRTVIPTADSPAPSLRQLEALPYLVRVFHHPRAKHSSVLKAADTDWMRERSVEGC